MILPLRRETIVLDMDSEDALARVQYATGKRQGKLDRPVTFVGKVTDTGFNISRYLSRPENFMPQIQGTIESTNQGSILFLKYTLQFSSRMFVIFWTITTLMFALFLWYIHTRWHLGAISLAVLVLNIVFTHISFQRQYRISREALLRVLDISG